MFENGKTPGSDGIPIEFYKKLWDILEDQLVDVFNYSFQLEEMTTSQRQAIITLIDKKRKDRSYLENWRPISLVNVDAKIASKVIANRIKCCLPDIIQIASDSEPLPSAKRDETLPYALFLFIGKCMEMIV